MNLNDEIAKEIEKEEEERIKREFSPKPIQRTQVKAAKFAWMAVTIGVDLATAYAFTIILSPYWWYGVMWGLSGAGGLIFSEWLWERIGNNDEQTRISSTSKTVSAIAVLVMAFLSGIALIMGWQRTPLMEIFALISAVSLVGFHGWQAYQYHEKDDDYIAQTEDARQEALNQKEIRKVHRAGMRIEAKKRVHRTGQTYAERHGAAFERQVGRTFAKTEENHLKDVNPPPAGGK